MEIPEKFDMPPKLGGALRNEGNGLMPLALCYRFFRRSRNYTN
jgi:hypothetical protein